MFDPAWSGWIIRHGTLISPENWQATPGEIRAIPLMRLQIQGYQRDARIAREELDAMDEQPLPDAIPAIKA